MNHTPRCSLGFLNPEFSALNRDEAARHSLGFLNPQFSILNSDGAA
jgi:hypothetical protein